MATTLQISQSPRPADQLSLVSALPVKFDAAFLDRRMREHRMWQNREVEQLTEEIFREVLESTGKQLQMCARAR